MIFLQKTWSSVLAFRIGIKQHCRMVADFGDRSATGKSWRRNHFPFWCPLSNLLSQVGSSFHSAAHSFLLHLITIPLATEELAETRPSVCCLWHLLAQHSYLSSPPAHLLPFKLALCITSSSSSSTSFSATLLKQATLNAINCEKLTLLDASFSAPDEVVSE